MPHPVPRAVKGSYPVLPAGNMHRSCLPKSKPASRRTSGSTVPRSLPCWAAAIHRHRPPEEIWDVAACRGKPSSMFFPSSSRKVNSAAAYVCSRCPVLAACRVWAREQGRTLEPITPEELSRAWRRLVSDAVAAGVVPVAMSLHDGRHWCGTHLVAAGVDPRTGSEILGHADPGFTLRVYAHSDDERRRAAAHALGAMG